MVDPDGQKGHLCIAMAVKMAPLGISSWLSLINIATHKMCRGRGLCVFLEGGWGC